MNNIFSSSPSLSRLSVREQPLVKRIFRPSTASTSTTSTLVVIVLLPTPCDTFVCEQLLIMNVSTRTSTNINTNTNTNTTNDTDTNTNTNTSTSTNASVCFRPWPAIRQKHLKSLLLPVRVVLLMLALELKPRYVSVREQPFVRSTLKPSITSELYKASLPLWSSSTFSSTLLRLVSGMVVVVVLVLVAVLVHVSVVLVVL